VTEIVSASAAVINLMGNAADRLRFTHGFSSTAPKTDPKTVDEAQSVATASRTEANATALGDDRVYTAMREAALSVAYGRVTRRRLQRRLERIAVARARTQSKAEMLNTSIPDNLV
jgi:hypothetical protein